METTRKVAAEPAWVGSDGLLSNNAVLRREVLYRDRQGRAVERFTVREMGDVQQYIFKPLADTATLRREQWLQTHLFARLDVTVPRLVTGRAARRHELAWAVFVDLGRLNHHLSAYDIAAAARATWQWQRLTDVQLPPNFAGQKPNLQAAAEMVLARWSIIEAALLRLSVSAHETARLLRIAQTSPDEVNNERVLAHGDYHFENIARLPGGALAILDWEFVHINSVYWDLYSLLDMPHPRYRKSVSAEQRYGALEAYCSERAQLGRPVSPDFIPDYFRFTCIFTLWMLWLTHEDRLQQRWSAAELDGCEVELLRTLQAAAASLD